MNAQSQGPSGATLAAFATAVVIGGSNFVAVAFSNEELDPLSGSAIRFTAAAALTFLIVAINKTPLPTGRSLGAVVIYGLLGFGASYALLYYAVLGLGAGQTSIVVASTPLATFILAVLHRQEKLSVKGVIGGLLAIVGIGILSLRTADLNLEPTYLLAAVGGVLCIAESSVVIKNYPTIHPMSANAIGMSAGALFLVASAFAFGQEWALPTQPETWIALIWLISMGSVALFWLFLYVIQRWTASATTYAVAMMPVVAVTLGALLADEKITIELLLGGALVLLAVYVGALSRSKPAAPVPEPAHVEPAS